MPRGQLKTKVRVTFTVKASVWERCKRLKSQITVNWSEVVEEALDNILQLVERAAVISAATDGSRDEIAADLQRSLKTAYFDSRALINEVIAENVESVESQEAIKK
jgi:hypothetical protein